MIIQIRKRTLGIATVAIVITLGLIVTVRANSGHADETPAAQSVVAPATDSSLPTTTSLQTQTATMGAVSVEVIPQTVAHGEDQTVFTVYFNTHSVELDFDFTDIIQLRDDQGNTYDALEWTGNRGWHHVSGNIVFPALMPGANSVTLTVTTIENLTREFTWQLL